MSKPVHEPGCDDRNPTSPNGIVDGFARPFSYLRISVTDMCNLRCVYCMPAEGVQWVDHKEILSYEEIREVVEIVAGWGVRKVRLTGGEPLVRKDLPTLVSWLAQIVGIEDLGLTTNGTRLASFAHELAKAGLRRVNISLDTLQPQRFERIARRSALADVWKGIAAAEEVGLDPIKINVVVMGGMNDDEVEDFAALTLDRCLEVRFIELMPLGESRDCTVGQGDFTQISNDLTRERIERRFGTLIEVPSDKGPAEVFQIQSASGRVGFISPMSAPFCSRCDRLRMTSDGKLRSCLLRGGEVELKSILRSGEPRDVRRERILEACRCAAWMKPEQHAAVRASDVLMHRLGG